MTESPFYSFDDILVKEIAPGFFSKLIHTSGNTINFIEVKAGNHVALHKHPHEQYTFVLEGEFELTINDDTRVLNPGLFALVPSDTLHGGTSLTDCKLLDIFSPVREDYR
ncbi:cupin domain-containing protein [Hufsiella ginkgonis]|uniref:Cupin domain-containing protein n=1 Tax=Hufsiella ginkgonis TaxID=2695274 RepID=A0A7K1Y1M5_9SPHI|nr:cupin domain-containing protein [Hufsiella ginkgonis]MXV17027.1 cupin domain-containing protein [Hufsiella ginkgonis]